MYILLCIVLYVCMCWSTRPPISALRICQFSGYCSTSADCYPGNSCAATGLPYYSQCIADPTT